MEAGDEVKEFKKGGQLNLVKITASDCVIVLKGQCEGRLTL